VTEIAKIPRDIIARGVHVKEMPDRVVVSFKYMTPFSKSVLQGIPGFLQVLFFSIAISEMIQVWFAAAARLQDLNLLAEIYLGPLYHIYEWPRLYYIEWMTNSWGRSLAEFFIIFLAWLLNMLVWGIVFSIIAGLELVPAIGMRLPFFSSKGKVVFSPGEVAFGKNKLPVLSAGSSFRLDEAEMIRRGKKRLQYEFGKQEIVYDLGASKHRVATISNPDHAANVQNSLSLILEWSKMNISVRTLQPTGNAVVEDPDDFLR
jgi:hypothetical protein